MTKTRKITLYLLIAILSIALAIAVPVTINDNFATASGGNALVPTADDVAGEVNHDHTWLHEEDATVLPADGGVISGGEQDRPAKYYLDQDVELEDILSISGYVELCLNGYMLTGSGEGSVIVVSDESAHLTLFDCCTGEDCETDEHHHNYAVDENGIYDFSDVSEEEGTVHGGVITNGNATNGGGVSVSGGTFIMNGGTIAGNTSTNGGGGVYIVEEGSFTMFGGVIAGNHTDTSGGGVCVEEGTFTMSGIAEISHNTTNAGGAGVAVMFDSTFEMSGNAAISYNTATSFGGGVFVSGGSFTLSGDATISYNKAYNGGGVGVFEHEERNVSGEFTMTGGTISHNESNEGGGVTVSGENTVFIMSQGTISDNNSNKGGGVAVASDGEFSMTGGTITANTAENDGGGVYISGNYFELSGDATISENNANNGAGVYVGWGAFSMDGGTVSGNTATSQGGGVYVGWGAFSMDGGTVSGNTATSQGGGVYIGDSITFTMNDGVISENIANEGGGVYVTGTFEMVDGIINNSTSTGVYVAANATFNLTGGSITYNDIGVLVNGTFNISGVPSVISNTTSDVYLSQGKTITIVGALSVEGSTEEEQIYAFFGVTLEGNDGMGVFATGWSSDYGEVNHYFVLQEERCIRIDEGNLYAGAHSVTVRKYTLEQHWYECANCGLEDGRDSHNWSELTDSEGGATHEQYCQDDCGLPIQKSSHNYNGQYEYEDNELDQHFLTCTDGCGHKEYSTHSWTQWSNEGDAFVHISYCTQDCGVATKTEQHNYDAGVYHYNDEVEGQHYQTCKDCSFDSYSDHEWSNWTNKSESEHERQCNQNCGVAKQTAEHTYDETYLYENGNMTSHYQLCNAECGHKLYSQHVWSDWQQDIENHYKYCESGCGVPTQTAEHSYDDVWTDDPESFGQHYRICKVESCSYKQSMSHDYDDVAWAYNDGDTHKRICKYNGCDAFETAVHEYEGMPQNDPDKKQHYQLCNGCQTKVYSDHVWLGGTEIKGNAQEHQSSCTNCGAVEMVPHNLIYQDQFDGNHYAYCVCGYDETKPHVWTEWVEQDSTYHVKKCEKDCGAINATEAHVLGTVYYNDEEEGRHYLLCTTDTCGYRLYSDHVWGDWYDKDADNHEHMCTSDNCGATETAPHVYEEIYINDTETGQHYQVCTAETCAHKLYSEHTLEWVTDDPAEHWQKCTDPECGYTTVHVAHSYDEVYVNDDGAVQHYQICKEQNCGYHKYSDHSLVWVTDDPTEHWQKCTDPECGYTTTHVTHSYAEQYFDDAEKVQHYQVCEQEGCDHTLYSEHSLVWVTNDPTDHWQGCEKAGCTYELGRTEHVYGEEFVNDGAKGHYQTCTTEECGYKNYSDHDLEWTRTATGHSSRCTTNGCDYETSLVAHSYAEVYVSDGAQHYQTCTETECAYKKYSNHNLEWVAVDSTSHKQQCTANGCGYVTQATAHDTQGSSYSDEGNHDENSHWLVCTLCGMKQSSANHEWNEGVVTQDSTVSKEGVRTFTCKHCGATRTEGVATKMPILLGALGGGVLLIAIAVTVVIIVLKKKKKKAA